MKKQTFVRYTSEELDKVPDESDWARVRAMSEAELERNAIEDPDTPPWPDDDLDDAPSYFGRIQPKRAVSIRLDEDILAYFKEQGRGYQSRINGVLRAFMNAHQAQAKARTANAKSSGRRKGAAKKSR